jgi:predicted dithiol-disulfide oxidoreductase (DUF899 family)
MSDVQEDDGLPMWPVGASDQYIGARIELAKAERTLRDQIEMVAAARRMLPRGALMQDYALTEGPKDLGLSEPVRTTRLSELFGDHDKLFVYHLMYHPDHDEACEMCSMWVDGLHGVSHHLRQHMAFVVIGKAPLPKLRAWARRRGWDGLRILSSYGTTFNADVHAEQSNGDQRPMVSVFVRDDGQVHHFYTLPANFIDNAERGIDLVSPVWNVLDLLPTGRGNWYSENSYAGRERG